MTSIILSHVINIHITKMKKQIFYFNRVLFFTIFFLGFSYTLSSQEISKTKNDSVFYSHIKKVYAKGISKDDFLQTCFIQWNPIKNDSVKWEPFSVDISRQIRYAEFDEIIHKLSTSSIVKAYTASIKSEDGRPMYYLEIGNGPKTVTFTAGVHAREVANPQFMLKFAAQLVSEYEKGYFEIKDLLSKTKVVILPCVNPDGYEATSQGKDVIQNKNLFFAKCSNGDVYQAKSNARGVDLNRNFPSYTACLLWNGNNPSANFIRTATNTQFFAGDSLGSENETRVAMNFLMKYIPISFRYVDFHSVGRIIYSGKPHLSDSLNILCKKTGEIIAKQTKYRLLGLDDENSGDGTDGTITDFATEVATGFVYNPTLGRLAPADSTHLVRKTKTLKYSCSTNTVETLVSLFKEKKSSYLKPSTPQMHVQEWENCRLYNLFLALMKE